MSSTGRNLEDHPTNPLGAYDTPLGLCRAVVHRLVWLRVIEPGTAILEPSVGSGNMIRAVHQVVGELEDASDRGEFRGLPDAWVPRDRPRVELEAMDLDPLAPGLDLVWELGGIATSPSAGNFDAEADARARARLEAAGIRPELQELARSGFLVTRPARTPDLVLGNVPYSVTAAPYPCPDCAGTGLVPGARGRHRKCPRCNRWAKGKRPEGLAPGFAPGRIVPVADLHVLRALELTRRHLVQVLRLPYLGGQERHRDLWSLGHLRACWTVVGRPSYAFGGTDSVETAVYWWDRTWNRPTFEGGWITWEDSDP